MTGLVTVSCARCRRLARDLRRQNHLLQALITASPDAIFVKDAQGRYIVADRRSLGLDMSEQDPVGRSDHELFPAAAADLLQAEDQRVLAADNPTVVERQVAPKGGAEARLLRIVKRRLLIDGIPFIFGTTRDITADRRSEQEILSQRNLLQAILDTAPLMLWLKDREGRFTFVNQQYADMNREQPEGMVGNAPSDYSADPQFVTAMAAMDRAVLAGETVPPTLVGGTNRDGEHHDLLLVKRRILPPAGEGHWLLGMAIDVTAWQRSEEVRRTSERLLQTAIDNIPCAFVAYGADGACLAHNIAARELLGGALLRLPEDPAQSPAMVRRWQAQRDRALAGTLVDTTLDGNGPPDWRRWREILAPIRCGETVTGVVGMIIDLTQQQALEERLDRANAFLSTVVESSLALIAVLDPEGRIQMSTSPGFRRLGYDERLQGTPFAETAAAENRAEVRALLAQVRDKETVDTHEHAWLAADGRVLWVAWSVVPLRASDGSVVNLIASGIDITAQREERCRREAEERKAQEALALALAAFRASPDAIIVSALDDGRILDVNQGFERHFGWSREEAIGRRTGDLIWHDPTERESVLREIIAGSGCIEARPSILRLRDGTTRHFQVSIRVAMVAAEARVLSVCTDITDLQRLHAELRQALTFTSRILKSMEALVIVLDRDRRIVCFNDACATASGRSQDEMRGRRLDPLMQPELLPAMTEAFIRVLNGEHPPPVEHEWLHRNGSRRHIRWSLTSLTDEHGRVEHVVGTGIDLTDQRRATQGLVAAEREAVVGRMAARVAHEVNNPLAAMKAYLSPLRQRCLGQPELEEGLQLVEDQVDRIASLLRELLGFVRQRTTNRSEVASDVAATSVVNLFRPRCEKLGIRLDLHIASGLPTIRMDVEDVQQVLINLLENALAEIGQGGGIVVEVSRDGEHLHLVVQDDGPGLGPDPERLFQPFVTSKINGTGLGLPIARKICEAHGGSLIGRNRQTQGAEFVVRLPLRPSIRTPLPWTPREPSP